MSLQSQAKKRRFVVAASAVSDGKDGVLHDTSIVNARADFVDELTGLDIRHKIK